MNYDLLNSTTTNLLVLSNISDNRTSHSGKKTYMRYAQVIYIAILVTFGVCGNILCAIVFSTKSLRRLSSSSYLFVMALVDVFFLLDLLPGMVHTAFFIDLYRRMTFICYFQTYISFVASFVHIWMVLAFTAERFFAVNFPLKHMSKCTRKVSRLVLLVILIPALLLYIHPGFYVTEVDNKGQCREKAGYERYLNNLNIIDTTMTMFLPFIAVSILNILIIRKLFCSKVFRQHVFANGSRYQCRRSSDWISKKESTSSSNNSNTTSSIDRSTNPFISYRSSTLLRSFQSKSVLPMYRAFSNLESANGIINLQQSKKNDATSSRTSIFQRKLTDPSKLTKRSDSAQRHILTELRLTKMLMAISLTCLSLNFPSYYLRFMFLYQRSNEDIPSNKTNDNEIDFSFYRTVIFHSMSYLSYSINILIYLLFGGNFRRALRRLFSTTKTTSHVEQLTIHSRTKTFSSTKPIYGNAFDFNSNIQTSNSSNSFLCGHLRSITRRDQSNQHQDQFFIRQPSFKT